MVGDDATKEVGTICPARTGIGDLNKKTPNLWEGVKGLAVAAVCDRRGLFHLNGWVGAHREPLQFLNTFWGIGG